ncbi:AMP-binding protein [Streptomyces sp. NRRL B-1347]|uniref:AMP-binding protein n=1 Tax=Streptomyces sp. NRRL B-1347 TaxID=1476877 RepID=UPI001F336934|nr:AMP-binding protein [Streptomyces sp. NRRL B-1347]
MAAEWPERVAVVDVDGATMTYGELERRAHRLTRALARLGVRAGECVAAMLPNSRAFFELRLATGQSGLYFTPFSHHFTVPEAEHVLVDSGARVVVVDAGLLDVAGPALDAAGVPPERRIVWGGVAPGWVAYEELLAAEPATPPAERRAGGVMLYTSGTTGRPKAVRRQLSAAPPGPSPYELDFMTRCGVGPGPFTQLCAAPLYHAAPGLFANMALQLGHTVVLAERPCTEDWLRLVDRHGVDFLFTVPTVLHRLLRLPAAVRESYDTSSLRAVVHGAAPCPEDVKRRAIDWFGPVLYEFYAATEGGVTAVTSADWLARPGTVGLPMADVDIRVLDEDGRPLPAGETGGVYFRPVVPFAYHQDPDKTRRSMREEYFTAGDHGYLDADGWLYLRDRRTDLIVSGGVNVYPAEVEAVLLAHPEVADAAVVGVPDEEWGQRVAAVVRPEAGAAAADGLVERLVTHCRGALAGFKVPRVIEVRAEVPRSEAGKVLRREIRITAEGL